MSMCRTSRVCLAGLVMHLDASYLLESQHANGVQTLTDTQSSYSGTYQAPYGNSYTWTRCVARVAVAAVAVDSSLARPRARCRPFRAPHAQAQGEGERALVPQRTQLQGWWQPVPL